MVLALWEHYLYYTGLGSRIRKLLGNEQYAFADRSAIWPILINCFHCDLDAGEIKVLFDVARLNELSSVRKIEYVSCYLSAESSWFEVDEGCIMYCLFSILENKTKQNRRWNGLAFKSPFDIFLDFSPPCFFPIFNFPSSLFLNAGKRSAMIF